MMKIHLFFPLFCLFLNLGSFASASEGPWASADQVQARLVTPQNGTGGNAHIKAAVQMRVSPGWHSYWRSSGETGLPPVFAWEGSENVAETEVLYPFPVRFDELGFTTFGYDGDVTFPVNIKIADPEKSVKLVLRLDTMVCNEICVPQSLNMTLDLPAQGEGNSPVATMIDYAFKKVPKTFDTPDLKIENIVIGPQGVVTTVHARGGFSRADMFVEYEGGSLSAKPQISLMGADTRAMMIVASPEDIKDFAAFAQGKPITVTVTDGHQATEKTVRLGAEEESGKKERERQEKPESVH